MVRIWRYLIEICHGLHCSGGGGDDDDGGGGGGEKKRKVTCLLIEVSLPAGRGRPTTKKEQKY
jgi:hypothetical protein